MTRHDLPELPREPGCYQFRAADGALLYVGKASDLRRRVASYFRNGADARTRRIARRAARLDFIVTRTETEALLLEADLVRSAKPPFNVVLKRDAVRPYLELSDEAFPTLRVAPAPADDDRRVFGPYPTSATARRMLELVYRVLPLRRTGGVPLQGRERPCVRHDLGRCPAPCVGAIAPAAYGDLVDAVVDLLEGRAEGVVDRLDAAMREAARAEDFERAAALRDRIEALRRYTGLDADVVLAGRADCDAVAVACRADLATVQVFRVRGGRIVDREVRFEESPGAGGERGLLELALAELYPDRDVTPPLVLVPDVGLDRVAWSDALRRRVGHRVDVRVPRRGDKRRLLDLALRNARAGVAAAVPPAAEAEPAPLDAPGPALEPTGGSEVGA